MEFDIGRKSGSIDADMNEPINTGGTTGYRSPVHSTTLQPTQFISSTLPNVMQNSRAPPPIAPLPSTQQAYHNRPTYYPSTFGGSTSYSTPYTNSYLGSNPGMFGSSYYGRCGSGVPHPTGAPYQGGFISLAEESSQQAFQSIETLVHAVSSISMMLESTYTAMYSSFRAVVGVADQFNRLRLHLSSVFSILALVKALQWLYRKALYVLGLRKNNPNLESAWAASGNQMSAPNRLTEMDLKQKSNWPFIMFFAVVFGTPWLIWKLLSSFAGVAEQENKNWHKGIGEHYLAVAEYDFTAQTNQQVTFVAGHEIRLAPKQMQPKIRGWLLGSVDSVHCGLLPANYVRIIGRRSGVGNNPASEQKSDVQFLQSKTSVVDQIKTQSTDVADM